MTDTRAALWLLKAAGKYRAYIGWLLLLQTIVSGGAVCYALVMKEMIDCAVEKDRQGFFAGLFLFALLIVMQMALQVVLRHMGEATRSGLENTFQEKLFACLLHKDYAQVSTVHSEEWMNRLTSDTNICGSGMTEILPGFLGMMVRLVGAMLMIFFLQPQLAYIIVPGGVLFVAITLMLRKHLKAFHKKVQEKDAAVRVYLQERISSMLVIRTFGVEAETLAGARRGLGEYKVARMRKAVVSNLCHTGFAAAMNGMYLLGIGYCGYGILNGIISYGTLTAIIQLIGQLQAPLSGLGGFVPRFYAMLASAERLMEVESYKEARTEAVEAMEEARVLYDTKIEEIVFDKVSFDYGKEADASPVLHQVSLSVRKGDYVAIIGASGCGKSTLLKLLMGIYKPKAGTVGVLLKDGGRLPVGKLKRLFAYVPQGNYLMAGTIREVITFGKEESEEDFMTVERAIKLACGEFLYELSEGLNTLLGENGAGLSEGQMQRIAIARALYVNAPVLILDEATSALDNETEERLLHNLKQLTDKTVFIVTHRMEALKICNRQLAFSESGASISSEKATGISSEKAAGTSSEKAAGISSEKAAGTSSEKAADISSEKATGISSEGVTK